MVFVFCLFRYKIVWLQLLCQSSIEWILVSCYHPFEYGRSSCACLVSFSWFFFHSSSHNCFFNNSFSLSLVFVSVSMSPSLLNVCKRVCVFFQLAFVTKSQHFRFCLIWVCVFRIARQFSTKLHCVIMRVHIYDFPFYTNVNIVSVQFKVVGWFDGLVALFFCHFAYAKNRHYFKDLLFLFYSIFIRFSIHRHSFDSSTHFIHQPFAFRVLFLFFSTLTPLLLPAHTLSYLSPQFYLQTKLTQFKCYGIPNICKYLLNINRHNRFW